MHDAQVPHSRLSTRPGVRSSWLRLANLLVAAALLLTVSGCGGCRKDKASDPAKEKQADKDKKAKKIDFEFGELAVIPSDGSLTRNLAKPGHFVSATVPTLANNFDFRAELETMPIDQQGRPVEVPKTRYLETTSRPAVLPKGQLKNLEGAYFVPRETGRGSKIVFLQHKLRAAKGGQTVFENTQIMRRIPAYQYFFVVLASNPNEYGYINQLSCVTPPFDDLVDSGVPTMYYRVILPPTDQRIALPSHPLAWTSIAYVLWDGIAPENLTLDQSQAMLDWLHWGGQLIISGPDSLASLQTSFLQPYLPATFVGSRELDETTLAELNQDWSLTPRPSTKSQALDVTSQSQLVGIEFETTAEANFLPGTGQQVVERRVGRGRIVVTSFSLTDRRVVNWGSYDSFFNACLLRRPRRQFKRRDFGSVQTIWADFPSEELAPQFSTATRYFSRDIGPFADQESAQSAVTADWHDDGCLAASDSGMGGWNDSSGAATEARLSLRKASGISIPNARFVVTVLSVYLLVLVPINWGIFRILGRVEWAWVAAPIIAIVGALVVVRLAQLDIGFARSRTEIAILEGQGSYTRAHLTRYIALYTSLASTYEVQFDDANAFIQPFPGQSKLTRTVPITLRRSADARLTGFQVDSALTEFLHCEQHVDVGGPIQLIDDDPNRWQVRNQTDLGLSRVAVITRTVDGSFRGAWLDGLASGTTADVRWEAKLTPEMLVARLSELTTLKTDEDPTLDVSKLTSLAMRVLQLRPGDVRLVGFLDESPGGMKITPNASQRLTKNMVLWHLRYGQLPAPRPDLNLPADVRDFTTPEEDPATAAPVDRR
jgi:hypothetical protein